MHDIVSGAKEVQEAWAYYANEVLDYRRGLPGLPTPYMQGLRFPEYGSNARDPDVRINPDGVGSTKNP